MRSDDEVEAVACKIGAVDKFDFTLRKRKGPQLKRGTMSCVPFYLFEQQNAMENLTPLQLLASSRRAVYDGRNYLLLRY